MKQFEILDISGDAGIRASGRDLPELFVNAATGLYSLITDLKDIQATKTLEFSVEGSSLEGLLVSFLNELIFHFDTYGFIAKTIEIKQLMTLKNDGSSSMISFPPVGNPSDERLRASRSDKWGNAEKGDNLSSKYKLAASLTGEEFDPARHEAKLLIKAATYHKLFIEEKGDGYKAEIICDI